MEDTGLTLARVINTDLAREACPRLQEFTQPGLSRLGTWFDLSMSFVCRPMMVSLVVVLLLAVTVSFLPFSPHGSFEVSVWLADFFLP